MPIYEYRCKKCGIFEEIKSAFSKEIRCECGEVAYLIPSKICKPHITYKENLPLGNKSRGRYIPPEDGRAGILVPSYGLLDKEEVDYLAEAEVEKENTRIRRTDNKKNIQILSTIARNAEKGKRGKAVDEALGG